MSQCFYKFGSFELDTSRRLLRRGGESVPLTPKAFDILLALIESAGEIIGKDELIGRVWPDSFVEDGNLTYNISVLRKALGERAGEHQYILTVSGRGYRFVAAVNEASSAETAISVPPDASAPRPTSSSQVKDMTAKWPARVERHRWAFAAVALTVAALIIVGGYLLFKRRTQSPVSGAGQDPIRILAVLPLANGSGDPEMEYLSDGISESLINHLSQLPGVKVMARSSSFKYKGQAADPQQVAHALGVEAIVSGRVMQRGEQLQISVELMDARDNTQMWGAQYTRKSTDLLDLQAEISGEIAEKLRLKLTSAEQQQLARHETANPQAYELSLKGRFYWRKAGKGDRQKSIEYFQQATAVDPAYALAYVELSTTYAELVSSSVLDPKEFTPKAEAAARKALELDESLAEAHLALAGIKLSAWDWAAAERGIKRAIELNPNLAFAHNMYAFYLSLRGRHEQAIAEIKRARELDPLSTNVNHQVGVFLLMARQYDQAMEAAKKTLELDQNYSQGHTLLGYIYTAKEMYTEAIAAYQEAIKLGDDSPDVQIDLGAAYAKAGERGRAQTILKQLEMSKAYISPGELAVLYMALGERKQAYAALERAYAAHDISGCQSSLRPFALRGALRRPLAACWPGKVRERVL